MRSPHEILLKPRITEKGSMMSESQPVVIFEVARDANKVEIRQAVQSAFNVDVANVRTLLVRGKIKRRGKSMGQRPKWKKAFVTLAEGQTIDFFGSSAV